MLNAVTQQSARHGASPAADAAIWLQASQRGWFEMRDEAEECHGSTFCNKKIEQKYTERFAFIGFQSKVWLCVEPDGRNRRNTRSQKRFIYQTDAFMCT